MAYKSDKALFTDKDPNGPEIGQILESGGSFRLCAAGGEIPDDVAKKFGLDKQLTQVDKKAVDAEREARNRATYDDNAVNMDSKAYQGYPTQVNAPQTTPTPEQPVASPASESKRTVK